MLTLFFLAVHFTLFDTFLFKQNKAVFAVFSVLIITITLAYPLLFKDDRCEWWVYGQSRR